MLPQSEIDIIATKIVLDAREALNHLAAFSKTTEDVQDRLDSLKKIVTATANQMGGDLERAEKSVQAFANSLTGIKPAEVKQVGRELRQIDQATKAAFANLKVVPGEVTTRINILANAIQSMAAKSKMSIEQVTQSLLRLNSSSKPTSFGKLGFSNKDILNAGSAATDLANKIKEVGNASQGAGGKAEGAFGRVFNSVNAVRIALGALVSMLLFQVIQAFSRMVQGALKGLTEIEAAMFNIQNAEKRLSEQGVDVTVEGLEKLIDDLQELDPLLSKFQATELISTLTTKVAPALGLGQTQIEQLAKSITILSVRNQALGKSFEEVEQQVITGLLSGRVTSGINQLGVKITDQIVQEEALRLRLVETSKAYSELNAKEKERIDALAIISILEQNTAQEAENLPAFLKTASGLIGVAKAEFQDLLTSLGQKFAPLLKTIFSGIISILQKINTSLSENENAWNTLVTLLTLGAKAVIMLVEAFVELSLRIGEAGKRLYDFVSLLPVVGSLVKALFPENPFGDTPTNLSPAGAGEDIAAQEKRAKVLEDAEEKIYDIMKDAREKRLDLEQDYQRKLADIARDYANKLIDIARDTAEKREDALRDYNQKVEDINRDTNQKIIDAQEDYRKKEYDRELEYQNRLRELREKFLLDLEDALHERDARQVLRLIRQYNLDKKNLAERRKLEEQQSKIDLQRKIADLELERKIKLENARREYEEKLAEIAIGEARAREEAAIWRKRQLEDARIWYQRQLQEQREYLQRKLQDLAQAIAKELQLTAAGAAAIQSLLASYFGASGISSNLLNDFANSIGNTFGSFTNGLSTLPSFSDTFNSVTNGMGYGFAEGGTLIARKPTLAMFGERGDEAVTFTPINRTGQNVGQIFGDRAGLSAGGNLALRVTLSDGLVAEIVETSLENVATHIEKIRRER